MALDPHFDKVALLLHFDGADSSTTFTDSSPRPKTVTAIGNAKISTAQGLFGGASGYFDGSGDALSIAHAADLNLASGDWTIEFWFYLAGNFEGAYIIDKDGVADASYPSYGITVGSSGLSLHLGSGNGVSGLQSFTGTTVVSANAWHHAALGRAGSTIYGFLDGVQQFASTQTVAMVDGGKKINIGARYDGSSLAMCGYLKYLRTTKGVARYTADFTPPTEPFPDSATPTVASAYAAAATPLGNPAALATHHLAARIAATTPLGAAQALAYSPPMGKAAAPTPLGDVQITAYAMVAGYAASPTPLGQPAALAFADTEALGTVGQNTAFGAPAVVLVNRVQDGIQLAPFIPPLTALQGMAPGSMTAQASSLPSPAFGTPTVQFATSHEAASLESAVAFGAPAVRSIHPADSFAPVQFGDVGAPAFAAHAASLQDGAQFGQPLAFTLHALPDWYAGLRFGAVAVQGTGVFPVLDGIELGEFGQPDLGATRHQAMPLHMLPQFGPVTISRGAMTC